MNQRPFIYDGKSYYIIKMITSIVFFWFVVRVLKSVYNDYVNEIDFNYVNVLYLITESVTFTVILISRMPKDVNITIKTVIISGVGTFYILFVELTGPGSGTYALIPQYLAAMIIILAIIWQIIAKIYLGRSFGILPANRGIVDNGPYGFVRHPIYFGYLMGHIGFLLNAFSIWNFSVFFILYIFQYLRIVEEEKVLTRDESYQKYKNRVHYRLVPYVI